jgi:hypothetical protein
MYDLWYHAIEQAERMAAMPDLEDWQRRIVIGAAPWLDVPAKQQVTITTRHYYDLFKKHLPELRPFSFITMLSALLPSDIMWRVSDERDKGFHGHPEKYDGLEGVAFYESPEGIRRMDTHDVVDIRHKTLRECLRDYFDHPEAKAANPRGIGVLERQHVVVVDQVYTGKETNQVLEELADESEDTLPYEDAQVFARYGLAQAIKAHGVKNVADGVITAQPGAAARVGREVEPDAVSLRTLYDILAGARPEKSTIRKILDGLNCCAPSHGCCADGTTPTPAELFEQRRRERRERGPGPVGGHGPEMTTHG